ncbi:pyocin knob domain-containing protein [Bacillus multifaciens]|uniref:pyocin knob domain-containing protein n=1 Tax=Bacillus multifaciens TaxID=3068506 RepID=UPI002740FA7E|nr:pyocin knob domain-containing protein [Bacillus sp. WLY-B-L8]MDP7981518.1 pyocin knob domain-containing protein [Bacillus sp. WLY-B-L8]
MSLSRQYYINTLISADERKELNLEMDNVYLELVNNNNFIVKVQQALLDLTTKEAADVTNLLALIASGNTDTLNTVKKLISDFLAAKPSNFDEVVAARLGEKTLYDLNQKIKTKLDNTDSFQQVKLTDDEGYSVRLTDARDLNLITKTGFYRGFELKNAPKEKNYGWYIQVYSHNVTDFACMQIAYCLHSAEDNSLYVRKKVKGTWTEWEQLGLAGAYDDIKNEVNKVKGAHPSLDAAIRSMIPYNSVNYYADFQKALNESAGKTLDIPAGTYTIGDLEIPSSINIRADPNAFFILKAGSTTFFTNKDVVNIGGYDKTRNIVFKGGIFDFKKLKDAKAFVLSHCQDVVIDTKIINGGESKSYVALNAVKDSKVDIEAVDCTATTSIGAVVGMYVFNDKNTLTNQNAKPYDMTPCDNVNINLKLKNVKKGLVEIGPVDKVIHKNITYNVQAENVLEELGLFNNMSYFKTEKVIGNDVGYGLVFQILNDTCEDFTIEGVNLRNGKSKETSRGVWFKSKEGDNAPQYKNVRILNPVVRAFNKGIVTEYGFSAKITNPDVQECWEDGIWNYFTLDWGLNGGTVKYNNKFGWDSRADVHIGELAISNGNKKVFRSILSNVQVRTLRVENLQDSIIANVIIKGGGFSQVGSNHNNKIDYLEVGW